MAVLKVNCGHGYHKQKRNSIESFAIAARDGVYKNNTVFPLPPITENDLETLINNFVNKYGAFKFGGRSNKGPYQAAYKELIAGLDSLADYVDTVANGDENIILLSGFIPTKAVSSAVNVPTVPGTPVVKRGTQGVMIAEVKVLPDAEFYGCLVFAGQPKPEHFNINGLGQLKISAAAGAPPLTESEVIHDLNKSRKKTFVNLEPGVIYHFYFYAGNANGVSQLSPVTSLMCA